MPLDPMTKTTDKNSLLAHFSLILRHNLSIQEIEPLNVDRASDKGTRVITPSPLKKPFYLLLAVELSRKVARGVFLLIQLAIATRATPRTCRARGQGAGYPPRRLPTPARLHPRPCFCRCQPWA